MQLLLLLEKERGGGLEIFGGIFGEKIGAVLSRIIVLVRQAGKSHEFELGSTQFDCYVMFWSIVFEFPT